MSSINTKTQAQPIFTHEGAKAARIHPIQQLTRSVMACMLWESGFYESGTDIAARIMSLVPSVPPENVQAMAIEAREQMKMRHVPLLLAYAMTLHDTHKGYVADTLARIIQRPDEITEFVALYFKLGGKTLSKQTKLGLARAFQKFDEYALAKYNRDKDWKLRDVLFLCHSKPADVPKEAAKWNKTARAAYKATEGFSRDFTAGELLYGKLVNNALETPDTWEVELSAGKDKGETFARLMSENKLGDLAFLRNLRNMEQAGVSRELIVWYGDQRKWGRVLPFRFIAAARVVPQLEPHLERWMFKCLECADKFPGSTLLVIDTSGSMHAPLSGKSDLRRIEAAGALAALAREICAAPTIYVTAGNDATRRHATRLIPARRGMGLIDYITGNDVRRDIGGGGIFLTQCMDFINNEQRGEHFDRVIVFTDEQDCDTKLRPADAKRLGTHNYMVNVAANKNGIGYREWLHIDGFSEAVIDYIVRYEAEAV